jgi:hypothetical protein
MSRLSKTLCLLTLGGLLFFQKNPNSQTKKTSVVNSFFSDKRKKISKFPKVRHVGFHIRQKVFKSARIVSGETK